MADRRSSIVTLTLVGLPLGAVALASAMPGQEMRRNLYPDRGACERDYSTAQCQQGSSSTGGSGGWHGPYYYSNRAASAAQGDPGAGRTGQITRTETTIRGGFGQFGHALRAAA
jgi:hypothetical protein